MRPAGPRTIAMAHCAAMNTLPTRHDEPDRLRAATSGAAGTPP
jgi:hypothetical protein